MRRPGKKELLLAAASLIAALIALEGLLIAMLPPMADLDPELGWRSRARGEEDVARTDEDGFRRFGDPASRKKKLLALGDSFTFARGIPCEETFYGRLGGDLEVFAYGGEGYGTLQEYMVYDRFADRIEPDIVLLQFHDDDFCDNVPECDAGAWNMARHNGLRRPYLSPEGKVSYAVPLFGSLSPGASSFVHWWMTHSRIVYLVLQRLGRRLSGEPRPWHEYGDEGRTSVAVTTELLRRFKARRPEAEVLVFATTEEAAAVEALCRDAGVGFIRGIPAALDGARVSGRAVYLEDGIHWTSEGHAAVAGELRGHLE